MNVNDAASAVQAPWKIEGEITIRNVGELYAKVAAFPDGANFELDLSAVAECDTAALQLICSARKTAVLRGVRFRAALSPAIENTAAALGLPAEELRGVPEGGAGGDL